MKRMVFFYPEGHEAHFERGHPERPERIEAIRNALRQGGLWDRFECIEPTSLSDDLLDSIHTSAYLTTLEMTCRRGGHLDTDTYVTPASWNLALNAAGGAIAVASSVWDRIYRRGFALTRPPGHHATRGQGMGFCLLNNIALAAEYLLTVKHARKLAIVDLDLHHGNGTQDIFWGRSDVFYFSTHQSPLYPGTGSLQEMGGGLGEGYNFNFPFAPGAGDQAFLEVMDGLVLPLLNRYIPEMILVSYGFDTHWSDPLGQLLLSAEGYARLIERLKQWADQHCQGRIALFLEGGYNLEAAQVCTLGVVAAMLDQEWEDTLGPSPYAETSYWKSTYSRAQKIWEV